VRVTAGTEDLALLTSLGEDLKFVLITSAAELAAGSELKIDVRASTATKCERCWHWREDVGSDTAHPTLCGRCSSNLYGAGETRSVA
jgi:isoleucyl-tRNA synthetase